MIQESQDPVLTPFSQDFTAASPKSGAHVRLTRHLGRFPRLHTANWVMIGQDGGQSIELGKERLFVFSDTLLAPRQATGQYNHSVVPFEQSMPFGNGGIFLANSAARSTATNFRQAVTELRYYTDDDHFPREILQATEEEHARSIRFWPEHGIYLNGKVYLYYIGIRATDTSSVWGFENIGAGLAIFDPETGHCERLYNDQNEWELWATSADYDFHFGVQVLQSRAADQQQYVYVYGTLRQDFQKSSAVLARVEADKITEPTAYEFLASPDLAWSSDFNDAYGLCDTAPEFSVSYNSYLDRYTMYYVEGHSRWLYLRTADDVVGPFSAPKRIAKVPRQKTSELVYLGFEHPEFSPTDGERVYISYCQPRFTPNEIIELRFQ